MPGYTKHEYEAFLREIRTDLQKCLKQVSVTLPQGYSIEDIEKSIDKFYPFEWRIINERYKEYSKADVKLAKFNKKQRNRMPSPREILSNLPETKVLLKDDTKEKYSLYYGSDDWREEYQAFCTERYGKNNKRQSKIEKALEKAQRVEPEFLDRLIGLYDRKNTSQKDKVYIVVELEKYYCEKTINFFKRIAHAEINFQLREEAVHHLLSLGHYAKLRKQKYMQSHVGNKKKRKDILDTYAKKRFSIESIPQELEYRIHNSKEQQIKSYDYFISHSFRDYCTVQSLIDKLNGAGMNVYCDWISDSDYLKRNLVCDATLEVIETRINQSNAVLFIASDYSYSSIWVKYELNYAEERGKTIYYVDTQSVDKDSFAIEVLSDKWFSDTDYKKIKQEGKLW